MHSSQAEQEANSPKLKVLIADDDSPTRMLLRAAITQWNYEIVEAVDGEQAWEILQGPNPPNLLILDWMMPKLDGVALTERIKKGPGLSYPVFIILLTQLSGSVNISRAIEAGADEFLSKPFNMVELRSRLVVGEKIIFNAVAIMELKAKCHEYAAFISQLADGLASLPGSAGGGVPELNDLKEKIRRFTDLG